MEIDEIVVAFGGGVGLAAVITAIASFITAVVTALVSLRKIREVGADAKAAAVDAKAAAHQVHNNSGKSLKDTADRTEQAVTQLAESLSKVEESQKVIQANIAKDSDMLRSHGHQLGEIRTELAAERKERQSSDDRHHDEHQRLWAAVNKTSRIERA